MPLRPFEGSGRSEPTAMMQIVAELLRRDLIHKGEQNTYPRMLIVNTEVDLVSSFALGVSCNAFYEKSGCQDGL